MLRVKATKQKQCILLFSIMLGDRKAALQNLGKVYKGNTLDVKYVTKWSRCMFTTHLPHTLTNHSFNRIKPEGNPGKSSRSSQGKILLEMLENHRSRHEIPSEGISLEILKLCLCDFSAPSKRMLCWNTLVCFIGYKLLMFATLYP